MDPDARLLDDLSSVAPKWSLTELRGLLGCFLFSEDDVFKRMGVLSGGERNRYAIARLLCQPANFLLLDEPTNHLDLRAKDVLLEALESYTGTVVLSPTIVTFSTSSLHAFSKSAAAKYGSSQVTTKTICGASAECRSLPSTRWPLFRSSKPHRRRPHQLNNRPRAASIPSSCNK